MARGIVTTVGFGAHGPGFSWALLLTVCVTLGSCWPSLGFHCLICTRKEKRGLTCVKALAPHGCSLNVNFLSFLGLLAGGGEVSDRSHQPDLRETQLRRPRRLHSSPVLTVSSPPFTVCKASASSPAEPPQKPVRPAGQCLLPSAQRPETGRGRGARTPNCGTGPRSVSTFSSLQQIPVGACYVPGPMLSMGDATASEARHRWMMDGWMEDDGWMMNE